MTSHLYLRVERNEPLAWSVQTEGEFTMNKLPLGPFYLFIHPLDAQYEGKYSYYWALCSGTSYYEGYILMEGWFSSPSLEEAKAEILRFLLSTWTEVFVSVENDLKLMQETFT